MWNNKNVESGWQHGFGSEEPTTYEREWDRLLISLGITSFFSTLRVFFWRLAVSRFYRFSYIDTEICLSVCRPTDRPRTSLRKYLWNGWFEIAVSGGISFTQITLFFGRGRGEFVAQALAGPSSALRNVSKNSFTALRVVTFSWMFRGCVWGSVYASFGNPTSLPK